MANCSQKKGRKKEKKLAGVNWNRNMKIIYTGGSWLNLSSSSLESSTTGRINWYTRKKKKTKKKKGEKTLPLQIEITLSATLSQFNVKMLKWAVWKVSFLSPLHSSCPRSWSKLRTNQQKNLERKKWGERKKQSRRYLVGLLPFSRALGPQQASSSKIIQQ